MLYECQICLQEWYTRKSLSCKFGDIRIFRADRKMGGSNYESLHHFCCSFTRIFFFSRFRYAPSHSSSTGVVCCLLQLMDMFLITNSSHNNKIRNITYWSLLMWLETQKFSYDYVTKRKSFVYIRKLFTVFSTVSHSLSYSKYLKGSSKLFFFFLSWQMKINGCRIVNPIQKTSAEICM